MGAADRRAAAGALLRERPARRDGRRRNGRLRRLCRHHGRRRLLFRRLGRKLGAHRRAPTGGAVGGGGGPAVTEVRVLLPSPLRQLARVAGEVVVSVRAADVTLDGVLDALEGGPGRGVLAPAVTSGRFGVGRLPLLPTGGRATPRPWPRQRAAAPRQRQPPTATARPRPHRTSRARRRRSARTPDGAGSSGRAPYQRGRDTPPRNDSSKPSPTPRRWATSREVSPR